MENRHVQSIPEDTLAQITTKATELSTLLAPYKMPLTPEERQEIPKMGEKTLSFVEKTFAFAKANPNLVPPFVDMAAFEIDFADARNLWAIRNSLEKLYTDVNDIVMTSGSEAYMAALSLYGYFKVAVDNKVDGAAPIYNELKTRFPGRGRRNASPETK